MSDWLMAGVWRLILRLPPTVGKKRVKRLAERARTEVGELTTRHRAVHHSVVGELPRLGSPIPPETIADRLGFPVEEVTTILDDLEARKGFLFCGEDRAVVWAYPVTVEPTPHRIRFTSGEALYAA